MRASRATSTVAAAARWASALALGGLALGCQGTGSPSAAVEARATQHAPAQAAGGQTARVELSADAQVIYRRSLARDPAPSCDALVQGIADPTEPLLEIAERVQAPAWSSIRAATCLLAGPLARVEPRMLVWVRSRAYAGLGLLVLGRLDRFDEGLATRLVDGALGGELASQARESIARSRRYPALRARALEAR